MFAKLFFHWHEDVRLMFNALLFFRIDSLKYFDFEKDDSAEINYKIQKSINAKIKNISKLY